MVTRPVELPLLILITSTLISISLGSVRSKYWIDELIAHDVELVLLGLEADVDDKVVELVHRHLHRVRRAVLRDRAAVREEDRRELAEERLHEVVGR